MKSGPAELRDLSFLNPYLMSKISISFIDKTEAQLDCGFGWFPVLLGMDDESSYTE
jgi:hypothetical protein